MKVSDRFHKGPVQDLLNAVVVQAAEDYREYSAKLIVQPAGSERSGRSNKLLPLGRLLLLHKSRR